MIYYLIVLLSVCLSFFLQEFVPVFEWAYGARLMLVFTVFLCASVTLPFPAMLLLATFTGFVWDARYHVPLGDSSELSFGLTVFILGILGLFIQGVRPLFRRGRWEVPVFMVGTMIMTGLLIEFLLISFHRGGLEFPAGIWFMMLMTSLFSMLFAPFILLLLSRLAKKTGFNIRLEGITIKRDDYGDAFSA